MARFRNISPDARIVRYGLPGPVTVEPGEEIDVSDAVARPPVRDRKGNVVQEAEYYADGYACQPTTWEAVPAGQTGSTPPPPGGALASEDTSEGSGAPAGLSDEEIR